MTDAILAPPLELWGGLECTVNRVTDRFHCQLQRNGHPARPDDIGRFASLGIRAIRYPVLWESVAPRGLEAADWSMPDERLPMLREHGVEPIVGLVHHGSGPAHTHLLDDGFAEGLAAFAGAVAERYPWISAYTPVNEPLTTARFSALYGVWYPHATDDRSFVRALLVQIRGVVLAMAAVRRVNPAARLVQTDDLGRTRGTPALADVAAFYDERRWLGWDLLCGTVDAAHPLWSYLIANGATPAELLWLRENRCPPDVVGVNYYVTGERWLDDRLDQFPARYHGAFDGRPLVDIEASRALEQPVDGVGPLLREAWARYGLPLAVTEAHIDARREDQLRWLHEIWCAADDARRDGADVRAVTVWALLGSFDWNCLVTACHGYYEPGPFDVRSPQPRPTALARLMRQLASGEPADEPVLRGDGWWRRAGRQLGRHAVHAETRAVTSLDAYRRRRAGPSRAILIAAADPVLRDELLRLCAERQLRAELAPQDVAESADAHRIEQALSRIQPWAVVHAPPDHGGSGDGERQRCSAAALPPLAQACAARGVRLASFGGDEVFDGRAGRPVDETDALAPRTPGGLHRAQAERALLDGHPDVLLLRSGPRFGAACGDHPLARTLAALAAGRGQTVDGETRHSMTYLPDLLEAALDLLVDHERGVWHLVPPDSGSWWGLVGSAAAHAGIGSARLRRSPPAPGDGGPSRDFSLTTRRGIVLPALDDAVQRWVRATRQQRQRIASVPGRSGSDRRLETP